MADSKENNNQTWQNLDWEKKVTICNQGISNEDRLLLTLVVLFIAFEAILFTILLGKAWGQYWSILLAFFGIFFGVFYTYFFEKRGNIVDYWGENLYCLWKQIGESELASHYKGCVTRRRKRKGKCGRWKVIFGGWCETDEHMGRFKRIISWFGCFKSTRRWFTTFIPLMILGVWILLMVVSIDC